MGKLEERRRVLARFARRTGAYLTALEKDPRCLLQPPSGGEKAPGVFPGIAAENIQARVRGNLLMALSNRHGWLVLTTGNKLAYQLAERVNHRAGRGIIPHSVLHRPPSAELRPDQRDEDSLPPYAELDPILRAYVEEDRAPEEIAALGHDIAVVREVVRLVDRAEYKRRQAPPGVKITPRAFGRDRRLPITNRYGDAPHAPEAHGHETA